jgi:hypothetical protein
LELAVEAVEAGGSLWGRGAVIRWLGGLARRMKPRAPRRMKPRVSDDGPACVLLGTLLVQPLLYLRPTALEHGLTSCVTHQNAGMQLLACCRSSGRVGITRRRAPCTAAILGRVRRSAARV